MALHHPLKAPVVQQRDLESTGIYPVNTRPGKDRGDPPVPVYLNLEKLKDGMKPLTGKRRPFGPWGATVSDLGYSTSSNASGRTLPEASMVLTVPSQYCMPPARVAVEVTLFPPDPQSSSSAHGDYIIPARPCLTQDSSGRWLARVEVDARVRWDDLQFILGHELTELSSLVRDNPSGVPSSGFGEEVNAGVMHGGTIDGIPTAHDRAIADEVAAQANELDRLRNVKGVNPDRIEHRALCLEALIKVAGLDSGGNIGLKMGLLREAGAPQWLIDQVQLGESRRFLDSTLGADSYLTPELVQHLSWPSAPTGGFRNGMSGGHFTPWLLDMAGPHTPYAFVEVCTCEAAGSKARSFEQYKWKGAGAKPMPGSGRAPGEHYCNPRDWTKATTPKTTFDDRAALLREANTAFAAWVAKHGNDVPCDGRFMATAPSGIPMQGYFETKLDPDGRLVLRTAYIDARWISKRAAGRSLVRSGDLASSPALLGERGNLWLMVIRAVRLLLRVVDLCREAWVVADMT